MVLADSHSILGRWKNYFYRLFYDIMQIEINTAEPSVIVPSSA